MKSILRAIIFDFNGVIVDDEPLHLELFRRVIYELGVIVNDRDYHDKYLGYDDRGCFIAVLRDAGMKQEADDVVLIDRLISRKAKLYEDEIMERYLLFPGVADLVRHLSQRYPLAIASGALRHEIELVLDRAEIRDRFKVIIAAEDVSACKPDPEGYLKALASLNSFESDGQIEPSDCLVIEDSISGIRSARRAGMRCLAVTNTYQPDELKEADWVVSSLTNCDPERLFSLPSSSDHFDDHDS
jgi:beta-phosphoglucomutase